MPQCKGLLAQGDNILFSFIFCVLRHPPRAHSFLQAQHIQRHLMTGATKLGMKEARHKVVQLQTAGHSAAGGLGLQTSLGAEKREERGQQRAGRSVTLLPAALKKLGALSLDQGLPQLFAHTCATGYDLSSPGEGCVQRKGCQALGMGPCLFLRAQRPPQDKGKVCATPWQGLGTWVWMEVVLVSLPPFHC